MSGTEPVDGTGESEPMSGAGGPKGTGPISCCASEPVSGAPPRRRRRVVALSAADRERVARGELPEAAAEEAGEAEGEDGYKSFLQSLSK